MRGVMKKIVFIVGAGRSGSTVLCKSIGSHLDGFAISELSKLKQLFEENSHCSCGKYYQECPFWREMLAGYVNKHEKSDIPSFEINRGNILNKFMFSCKYYLNIDCKIHENNTILKTFDIYEKIFNKTDADFLVDASKEIYRALMLSKLAKDKGIKCFFIFLTRDGRSVINSSMKKVQKLNWRNKTLSLADSGSSFWVAMKAWFVVNLRTFLLCNLLLKDEFIIIKYEEFVKHPVEKLKSISRFIGVEYSDDMTCLDNKTHHMMGGNASRINAKEIKSFSVKWDNLNTSNRISFSILAGWLNKILGYSSY